MTRPSIAELAAHPFLRDLPKPKLELIADISRKTTLFEGERLFEEGGVANRWWLLWNGQITLDLHLPGKGVLAIETVGRGEVLGWSWLFPPFAWRFGAVVDIETDAIEVDAPTMRTRCRGDAVFGREMYERFAELAIERLQATRLRLLDIYGEAGGDLAAVSW